MKSLVKLFIIIILFSAVSCTENNNQIQDYNLSFNVTDPITGQGLPNKKVLLFDINPSEADSSDFISSIDSNNLGGGIFKKVASGTYWLVIHQDLSPNPTIQKITISDRDQHISLISLQ